MKYNVWITLHGQSAKNAGIVGSRQATRSSWASGKLEYVPINDGSQVNFTFEAANDEAAWVILNRLFNESRPSNRRTLAGRSYLRSCREALRKSA